MARYRKLLSVGNADGERVRADIQDMGHQIIIRVPYIHEVLLDQPEFAKGGRISITVGRDDYKKAISRLETYLEGLFLKGLLNETVDSSSGTGADAGRNESTDTGKPEKKDSGKRGASSVHGSTRRAKSTEGSRGGDETPTLDESGSAETDE